MDSKPRGRERLPAALKLLACLVVFEAVYLFEIFGSHFGSSFSRWLVGFWLQLLGFIVLLLLWWRESMKARRKSADG